jgi:C-terminal processing protease CtpA/Prc
MRVAKITRNIQTREVRVVKDDGNVMEKRVTIVLAVLLVLSIASFAPVLAGGLGSGPLEEKNIRIRITGEGDEVTDDCVMVNSGDDIKVVMSGEGCGFIGINMEDLTEKIREKLNYPEETGVLVTGILEDSAAEQYGLEKEDIIYSFDGTRVADSKQLAELVMKKKSGDEVEIVLYREGKKKEVKLELGERKYEVYSMDWEKYGESMEKYARAAALAGEKAYMPMMKWLGTRGRLGLVLKDLDEDLAPYFDMEAGEGILVIEVMEDSPAEKADVKAGDVIVMVGGESVSDADDLMDEIYDCSEENEVELVLVRKGKKKNITLEIGDEIRFMYIPPQRIKKIEIQDPYEVELFDEEHLDIVKKKALEKEIEVLKKEIERLEKRLEKIEKE